tara:strand:+ start:179 stop:1165 length:987 start_codon:yes stop_codon:yes gene_type:complete
MKLLKLNPILDEEQISNLKGTFFDKDLIKHHITEDTKIVNEHGNIVAVYKKNAVPKEVLNKCRNAFRKSISISNNRGQAAGPIPSNIKVGDKLDGLIVGKIVGNRFHPKLASGKISKSPKARAVKSSIIGFSDRYPRIPYCRRTMFTQRNWKEYNQCLPYVKYVDAFFKQHAPARYKIQKKMAEESAQDFIIKDTAFSTVTVNKNFRTAGHYDNGDLKEGFGNLGVISQGQYDGAITVIPKYGIGLDLGDGDLAIFDVHELHGNTETTTNSYYERISVVCYYREKMIYCGNSEYELNRAKTNTKKVANEFEIEKAKKIKESILNECVQ